MKLGPLNLIMAGKGGRSMALESGMELLQEKAIFIEKWKFFIRLTDNKGNIMPEEVNAGLRSEFEKEAKDLLGL